MPRTGRGGKRAGADGTAYSNRTDLNAVKTLPAQAAPGQTYGDATAQINSQKQIPLQGPNAGMPSVAPASTPAAQPEEVPTLDAPGAGPEAMRSYLDNNANPYPNGVGGAYTEDPDHARIMNIVNEMANGPFASSAIRELADFMGLMI